MMSVPAINSVLPSSGNQPSKINTSPNANPSISPLGLAVPPKLSIIPPPQIPSSPSKPPIGVNHSSVPLSLVFENKMVVSQGQSKPLSDKPKDLSPAKSTPNGVEGTATKLPQPQQPPQTQTSTTVPSSKIEEPAAVQQISITTASAAAATTTTTTTTNTAATTTTPNHSGSGNSVPEPTPPPPPPVETTPANEGDTQTAASQVKCASPEKVEQSANQKISKEEVKVESKSNNETQHSKEEEPVPEKKPESEDKTVSASQPNKRKREQKPQVKKSDEFEPEKKTRRIRSQVLPYQSPLPELATFINKSLKEKDASHKINEEKLIVFYRNEFLAVRNAEGGFYLCQTLHNVFRTSHRIRIRWLSQVKEKSNEEGDIYTPDFYDLTDFECILTTVALNKADKNMYKLPKVELERIENILKRALDVEKGVTEKLPITEEHPDGIDLSLYKDESQLQKPKKAPKRKVSSPQRKSPKDSKKDEGGDGEPKEKKPKKTKGKSRSKASKKMTKTTSDKDKARKRVSGRSDTKSSKAMDQLKVSPPNEKARVVAKVLRKVEIAPAKEITKKQGKAKARLSKNQKKIPQRNVKKGAQKESGKEEPSHSHHDRKGKNKYSTNKSKKN